MWSGPTAAYSFELLRKNLSGIKKIFVLGNSHFKHFEGFGISKCNFIENPFGKLFIDT